MNQAEAGKPGLSRRQLISGLAAAATGATTDERCSAQAAVQVAADALADKMAAMHGGTWLVRVDHASRVVLILAAT